MAVRKPYPSERQERFIIRFPDGMRGKIATLAKANGRSMNAEVINMIEASLSRTNSLPSATEVQSAHDNLLLRDAVTSLLDHLAGQTLAQRLQTVGPVNVAKAIVLAYDDIALAALMKEIGVEKALYAIGAAAPELLIEVSDASDLGSTGHE